MSKNTVRVKTGIALLGLAWIGTYAWAVNQQESYTSSQIAVGRRIYETGISPNNVPIQAHHTSGLTLSGSAAACITCHRRSGMGSIEGSLEKTLLVPPIAGKLLFAPSRFAGSFLDPSHHYIPNGAWARALTRPAYTATTFARALRDGIDPSGKPLVAPMLRYDLDEHSISALTAYLQQLSNSAAPGVTDDTLHIATIITAEADTADNEAIVDVIKSWSTSSRTTGKSWQLHVWRLDGKPDNWITQLSHYYAKQPVFAVLSGNGTSNWLPIHQFCESKQLPCILPSVEIAPEDSNAYYSVYYSPGVTLEARLLARHFATSPSAKTTLLQVYSDTTGQLAAKTLYMARRNSDQTLSERRFRATAPAAVWRDIPTTAQIILWLRPAEIAQLVEISPQRPPAEQIYLSALLAPPGSVNLPPMWKARIAYVSLFDDLGLQGQLARIRLEKWLDWHNLSRIENMRLQSDAYTACYLFSEALAEIRAQEVRRPAIPLSREQLLETLETLVSKYDDGTTLINPDSHIAFYGRMSLGPAQRIAVRGGTIFRYATQDSNKLIAISKRIVP